MHVIYLKMQCLINASSVYITHLPTNHCPPPRPHFLPGIIEYNYQVVKEGIQRMLSVNQQAIKSQRSSVCLTESGNDMPEENGDNAASSNSNNNNVEDPVV